MTLKDIAEKAGVSMMTVSNVINGKHSRVSAATIEKVNTIIKEYNYVPNLSARSLTVKSSHIIGVIVPLDSEESPVSYFDNPYVSSMIGVIERELRNNGYFVMIRSVQTQEDLSVLDVYKRQVPAATGNAWEACRPIKAYTASGITYKQRTNHSATKGRLYHEAFKALCLSLLFKYPDSYSGSYSRKRFICPISFKPGTGSADRKYRVRLYLFYSAHDLNRRSFKLCRPDFCHYGNRICHSGTEAGTSCYWKNQADTITETSKKRTGLHRKAGLSSYRCV